MKTSNFVNVNITTSMDLSYLYLSEIIDFSLYKALNHIITYTVTDYHKSYRVSSHNTRIKELWHDFKLWYKRSNNKLTLHSLFNILKAIKCVTYYIDKHDYTIRDVNTSYKRQFYNILNSVREQYNNKISA